MNADWADLDRGFKFAVRAFHRAYFLFGPIVLCFGWGDGYWTFEFVVVTILLFIYYVGCEPDEFYQRLFSD